jgi:hypothetical protein
VGFIWGREGSAPSPRYTRAYSSARGFRNSICSGKEKSKAEQWLLPAERAPRLSTRILFCALPSRSPACMRQTRRRRRECVSDMTESKQRTHESPPQARHAPGRGRPLEAGLSDRTLDPPQESNGLRGERGGMTREGKVGALHTAPPAPALLLCYGILVVLRHCCIRHYEGGALSRPTSWGFGIIILQTCTSFDVLCRKQAGKRDCREIVKWFQLRSFSWGQLLVLFWRGWDFWGFWPNVVVCGTWKRGGGEVLIDFFKEWGG